MNKNIALVLSGGGARGMAHIGVLEELEERGYTVTSISGTSMGALVGGIYALGKLKEFKDWATSLGRDDMFGLVDFSFGGNGLLKGEKVLKRIKEFVPEARIEDLPIDFSATSVDLKQREEVVFNSGSLFDAIRASIAVPTLVTPISSEGAVLVDGGIMNNLPVSNVKRHPGDLLVAVHVNAAIPVPRQFKEREDVINRETIFKKWINKFYDFLNIQHPKEKKERLGLLSLIDQSLAAGMLRQVELTVEKYQPDVLINVSREAAGTYDFFMTRELIELGRYAAIPELDKLKFNG